MRQRKVLSNKLFLKSRRLCGELLEVRGNANLMRKILMRYEGRGKVSFGVEIRRSADVFSTPLS